MNQITKILIFLLLQVLVLNSCVSFSSVTTTPKENLTFTINSLHSSYLGHSWLEIPRYMEFGNPPLMKPEDYLKKARDLLNSKADGNIEEHISKTTGTTFKYNKSTGEYAIGNEKGEITTYYKPRFNKQFDIQGNFDPSVDWKSEGYDYFKGEIKNNP